MSSRICIIGLGYVGLVQSACLSSLGIEIVGVDKNENVLRNFSKGESVIFEPGLQEKLSAAKSSGLLYAEKNISEAAKTCSVFFITVGTPSNALDGSLDLSAIFSVCEELALVIKNSNVNVTIAIRSTVKPGTCRILIERICAISQKKHGADFLLVSNPEFLREGTAISDYFSPPFTLIGSSADTKHNIFETLYGEYSEIRYVDLEIAELMKYINNSWHALKVAFANEVGSICQGIGVEGEEVMSIFADDTILNISSKYLVPGFAYGGACLPKDLMALNHLASEVRVSAPLLNSVEKSNQVHIERALNLIKRSGNPKNVSIIGMSFKNGTDDLRGSPVIKLAHLLQSEGIECFFWDDEVLKTRLNKTLDELSEVEQNFLSKLYSSFEDAINMSEVVVVCKKLAPKQFEMLNSNGVKYVDLHRQTKLINRA